MPAHIKYPARMERLAELLLEDARRKKGSQFDMGTWGLIRGPDTGEEPKPQLQCNTRACAMGTAAISGIFKRAGLGYYLTRAPFRGPGNNWEIGFKWKGQKVDGCEAAEYLFGISNGDATDLFCTSHGGCSSGSQGERNTVRVLRSFIKTGSTEFPQIRGRRT